MTNAFVLCVTLSVSIILGAMLNDIDPSITYEECNLNKPSGTRCVLVSEYRAEKAK